MEMGGFHHIIIEKDEQYSYKDYVLFQDLTRTFVAIHKDQRTRPRLLKFCIHNTKAMLDLLIFLIRKWQLFKWSCHTNPVSLSMSLHISQLDWIYWLICANISDRRLCRTSIKRMYTVDHGLWRVWWQCDFIFSTVCQNWMKNYIQI